MGTKVVVLSVEEAETSRSFLDWAKVEVPAALQVAYDNFTTSPSYEAQEELRFRLAELIATSDHEIFNDFVFSTVRPETQALYEQMLKER